MLWGHPMVPGTGFNGHETPVREGDGSGNFHSSLEGGSRGGGMRLSVAAAVGFQSRTLANGGCKEITEAPILWLSAVFSLPKKPQQDLNSLHTLLLSPFCSQARPLAEASRETE